MELKVIEGIRVAPGETLVVIPKAPLTSEQMARCQEIASRCKINVVFLAPDCKVYIQEPSHDATNS